MNQDVWRQVSAIVPMVLAMMVPAGVRSPAPTRPSCEEAERRQFDFWLGTWNVQQRIRSADGTYLEFPAVDTVRSTLDGCAIREHWHGTVQFFWAGMTRPVMLDGLSVRAWDRDAGVWRIHWMDSLDPRFGEPFSGTFSDGKGVFTLEAPGRDGAMSLRRITFTPRADGSVDWELAVRRDGGEWVVLWTMHFTRT